MSDLFKLFGFDTEEKFLEAFKFHNLHKFHCYPQIIDENTTGFHHSTTLEEGPPHDTSTLYVWVKGKRLSIHFRHGKLDNFLVPTSSMVYC